MTRGLFLFGWPSHYGGADTKFTDLVRLLCGSYSITVIPNFPLQLDQRAWRDFFETLGVRCCTLADLPDRLEGIALAVGNDLFFESGICKSARAKGLKIVWSVEMMWSHPGEVEAIRAGEVDRVLYVSAIQKRHLDYESLGTISTRITGNYVDPHPFPLVERPARPFTIGRLSRAVPEKYPEDFPVFYEALELPDPRFRVMAWSDELAAKYRWHRFGPRWELAAARGRRRLPLSRQPRFVRLPAGPSLHRILGVLDRRGHAHGPRPARAAGAPPRKPDHLRRDGLHLR